jgi:hypothetical protein
MSAWAQIVNGDGSDEWLELCNQGLAEVRSQRDTEITAWLEKMAREYRSTGSDQHRLQAQALEAMASKIARGAVHGGQAPAPEWHPFTAATLDGCSEGGRICTQHCQEPCEDAIVAECPIVEALNGPLNDCIADVRPGSYVARISPDGDDVEIRPNA